MANFEAVFDPQRPNGSSYRFHEVISYVYKMPGFGELSLLPSGVAKTFNTQYNTKNDFDAPYFLGGSCSGIY